MRAMIDEPTILSITNVEKRYNKRTVLQIEHFTLAERDLVCVIGENGSGKSTFLRLLAGVTLPSSGLIERSPAMRRIKIGFAPQSGGLYEDMTVRQNLNIYCRLYKSEDISDPQDHWFIRETMLKSFCEIQASNLSGGLRKLATLACVLATDPDGLFLDEPTSDLDSQHSTYLKKVLGRLSETLRFIVLSTHDERVLEFFNRKIVMSQGRII
jgi:ABC-type multidrug transport system ATPase subunit